MIETNLRIIRPGITLYVNIKKARAMGTDLSADLLQRACGSLCYQHGLAACPHPDQSGMLLVASNEPVPPLKLKERDWAITLEDTGEPIQRLTLADPLGAKILPRIVERALQATLSRRTQYWRIDSPRIWYEPEVFRSEAGVGAYRRFEMSGLVIDDVGIGIAVDVGTAFFSTESVAYYFDPDIASHDQRMSRKREFENLTSRQTGQKGTLLYSLENRRLKCYFEDAPEGKTCLTTGEIHTDWQNYPSLAAYYREEYPGLQFDENGRAIRVLFNHRNNRPVWVAAELLRIRVMNDAVPDRIRHIDKMKPNQRRRRLQSFWNQLGNRALGQVAPGFYDGFWRPDQKHVFQLSLCNLAFGNPGQRQILNAPEKSSDSSYRGNYRTRLEYLEEFGCYLSPPTMPRHLYIAHPEGLESDGIARLASDLAEKISSWTKRPVAANTPVPYNSVSDAIRQLEDLQAEIVVFILNNEITAYHEIAFQRSWRVKRITRQTFQEKYKELTDGAWDRRRKEKSLSLGARRWESFTQMNALAILQLLDAVPFRAEQLGDYEAQLAIDVGHDRRHFALSLLVTRGENKRPDFRIRTNVIFKPDHQHETINQQMLTEEIINLVIKTLGRRPDPLESLLILRDGEFRTLRQGNGIIHSDEVQGILDAVKTLQTRQLISAAGDIHLANLHKTTHRVIRLWEVGDQDRAKNPLEGTALLLNRNMVSLVSTGRATLTQATAQPLTLTGNGHCPDMIKAAQSVFISAQHNWSSPEVAQRYPLPIKNVDEELKVRYTQEIKRTAVT
jgi:hypothetical protein